MSHVVELSDEQYGTITRAAVTRGTTPDAVLAQPIEGLREPHTQPRYYETDEWFRHLGMSDEEIEASKRRVRDEAEMPYGADA
jgi:hypothetical protein